VLVYEQYHTLNEAQNRRKEDDAPLLF